MRIRRRIGLALLATAAMTVLAVNASSAGAAVAYDAVPASLPSNVSSEGFQATATSEFGDDVVLGGTGRALTAVTVTMSDWATHSAIRRSETRRVGRTRSR